MKLLLFDREEYNKKLTPESVTLLTDSALLHPGNPLFVPDFAPEFIIDLMPAITISRLGKSIPLKFAERYFTSICFLARVVPVIDGTPVRHGSPSVTDFDNAIIIGQSLQIDTIPEPLSLLCNGETVEFKISEAMFNEAIELLSQNITLKMGDVIATCRLPIHLKATIDSRVKLSCPSLDTDILNFRIK